MKDRIKKVMDESGLSASKFADKIGVPRSGLSHVLSGRNKPSLDYVIKLLNTFPNLDPNWLIKGQEVEGDELQNRIQNELTESSNQSVEINNSLASVNKKMGGQADKLVEQIAKVSIEEIEGRPVQNTEVVKGNALERIVYFYSDGSFKEYFPIVK